MNMEKLKAEFEKAKEKALEWQARAKDMERRITEQENLEIIRMVRGIHASPEELKDILGQITSRKEPQVSNQPKEGQDQHEE